MAQKQATKKRPKRPAAVPVTPPVPDPAPLRLEWRSPGELAENPRNWRRHPPAQLTALTDVIADVGWAGACLFNERTGRLIDGHARRKVAIEQGTEKVPVLVGDWSEEQERTILATLDPLAALAQADGAALDALLREVQTGSAAVAEMLRGLADDAGLAYGGSLPEPGAGGDDFDVTPAESGPTRTAVGDLWLIRGNGLEHRLLVGDCTVPENVARLMGGERAEMVWTDPPYGVGIGDKNKYLNSIGPANRVEENLQNDMLDEPALASMLAAAFGIAAEYCLPGASWYVAAPAGPLHLLFADAMKHLGILRQMLIWKKNNATFSPLGVSYHWRHEPIFYGWLPDGGHRYYGGRQQDTVWEVDRPQASPEHPTMKPVALVARAVENSSKQGDLVYDPYLGSGTSIIAAHRLGRRAFGCEIEPRYADVVLKRCEAEGMTAENAAG